jgi:uncharacterized coiled-coil DUF342 family protein
MSLRSRLTYLLMKRLPCAASENANRLLQTRSLNDEIDELHVKVLEERAARAAVAEQLRKAKEELARLRNAVRNARRCVRGA